MRERGRDRCIEKEGERDKETRINCGKDILLSCKPMLVQRERERDEREREREREGGRERGMR